MPHALRISNDRITGFDKSRPQPLDGGWVYVTAEQFETAKTTPRPMLVDGEIVSAPEPPPAPPPPLRISKLKLRRTLRNAGSEKLLNDFLKSSEQHKDDWNDAQFLLSNDPFLLAAIPAFCQATGMTEQQVQDLLATAKESIL